MTNDNANKLAALFEQCSTPYDEACARLNVLQQQIQQLDPALGEELACIQQLLLDSAHPYDAIQAEVLNHKERNNDKR